MDRNDPIHFESALSDVIPHLPETFDQEAVTQPEQADKQPRKAKRDIPVGHYTVGHGDDRAGFPESLIE